MSCDYHVYCKTCDEQHPFLDANWQAPMMHAFIKHARLIAGLVPLFDDPDIEIYEFRVYYGAIKPHWFAKHVDHELVVRDEYGQIEGICHESEKCEHCDSTFHCILDAGHPGPHQGKRR